MKRIGTVKQTISGLANLFWRRAFERRTDGIGRPQNSGRQPGFTKACRMILMEGRRAMNAHDICDYFQQKMPCVAGTPQGSDGVRHNRPQSFGGVRRAQAVVSNGRRAWLWIAEEPAEVPRIHEEPRLVANVVSPQTFVFKQFKREPFAGLLSCFLGRAALSRRQEHSFFQMSRHVCVGRCVRIVRYHNDRLLEILIQPLQNF